LSVDSTAFTNSKKQQDLCNINKQRLGFFFDEESYPTKLNVSHLQHPYSIAVKPEFCPPSRCPHPETTTLKIGETVVMIR
jgi:hypothetical protein